MFVVLDTSPLSMVTNPKANERNTGCQEWLRNILLSGIEVCVPEVCDYELRRELIRARKREGLARLDALCNSVTYLPIDTAVMRRAAEFWAQARNAGKGTAADPALDGDMILSAHAHLAANVGGRDDPVIATENVGHLNRFADARLWSDITPL